MDALATILRSLLRAATGAAAVVWATRETVKRTAEESIKTERTIRAEATHEEALSRFVMAVCEMEMNRRLAPGGRASPSAPASYEALSATRPHLNLLPDETRDLLLKAEVSVRSHNEAVNRLNALWGIPAPLDPGPENRAHFTAIMPADEFAKQTGAGMRKAHDAAIRALGERLAERDRASLLELPDSVGVPTPQG